MKLVLFMHLFIFPFQQTYLFVCFCSAGRNVGPFLCSEEEGGVGKEVEKERKRKKKDIDERQHKGWHSLALCLDQ